MGVLLFLLKVLLRTVPVAFGVGVLGGTIVMGYACYQAFSGAEGLSFAQMIASTASGILISSAVLPLAAYLLFLLCSLVIELCGRSCGCPARPINRPIRDDEQVSGL